MSNLHRKWAATAEGQEAIRQMKADDGISNSEAMRIVDEKAAAYNEKQAKMLEGQGQDPNLILGNAMKNGIMGKNSSPQSLNAINNMVEDMGIYNEVGSKIEKKKASLKPPKGQKVVDVPVDISRSWSYLADDLEKLYDYDVEADWDTPLLKSYSEVAAYKAEVGDMTESNKKDFVYNFLESDFYQKHLGQFMKDNPGMNYKYADFVMSNMFTKLLLVGAKGVMKPASFDDYGSPKSWKVDRFSVPMMNSEYMKMVDEFGESVNKGGVAKNEEVQKFEDSFGLTSTKR